MGNENKRTEHLNEAIRLHLKNTRHHRCVIARSATKFDIPHAQHRMLMRLSKEENLSQRQLADIFEISPAAIAVALKKLEGGGYIKRRSSEGDSRVNEIELTEKGRQVVKATRSTFSEIDSAMFDGFSCEELESYNTLMRKIEANLYSIEQEEAKL